MIKKLKIICSFGLRSIRHLRVSFSQFGEDFYLREEFAGLSDGFFVDVGAFHPFKYSNTHYLRSKGWRGINIEPQPECFNTLKKICKNDTNLNIAISNKPGDRQFNIAGVYSHILADGETSPNQTTVSTSTLLDVLVSNKVKHINLLTIDCEGFDLEVLETNDWDLYRPSVVMVEDHSGELDSGIDRFMNSVGYRLTSWYKITKIYKPSTK
jgi:FkbM family methyltransferase